MKIFVVGAKGYIGKVLFAEASKRLDVYGTTSDLSTSTERIFALRLDRQEEFNYELIGSGDMVYLTAAISAPDICAREYERAWEVNVTGTANFIQNVIDRGARVVFFSSDTVYGEREIDFDESAPCNPAGEYAEMKCEVERMFSENSSFKSIRLSYVFSYEDKFSRYLVECAKRNEEANLFHPFLRAIIHRDDVVEGALQLAECWDEVRERVINFGGPQVLSRLDFAKCFHEFAFNALRFKLTYPEADFFRNRPRVIAMRSPVLARLLGRSQRTLREAIRLEFDYH